MPQDEGESIMCTAISFLSNDHYFGRNLDLEYSFQEAVTVTPRNFPFIFRMAKSLPNHYAIIGIATVSKNYPLYYEATNEMGLSMAGLNFPGNAFYTDPIAGKDNIAPFELIPWILGQCSHVAEAKALLENINIAAIPFSSAFSLSPLHWILADATESINIEAMKSGIVISDNPVGILTNNPSFDYHMHNLSNYLSLSPHEPRNTLAPELALNPFSRGMGAIGLPGDLSSASRFIRAVFTKTHSAKPEDEAGAVGQFFHILDSVAMVNGTVRLGEKYEKTVYSSCCNTDKGIYYYTTYENRQITAIHLYHENLNGHQLISYPLLRKQQILLEN